MNRKQKILVSIFSIIILILIMVGITYAYFVTNIQGNPNDTSIIMTSADLKLVYGDGNGLVEAYKIMPGDDIKEKTFTVTNTGTSTIENYGIYLEDVINDFINTNDIVYSLTCSSNKSKSCNGITRQVFPDYNELLVTNSIDKDEIQSYSLKVSYLNVDADQSIDMNKTLIGKIQIYNVSDVVNITGKVINYADGDYVEVENNKSQINKDGTYKVVGIPTKQTIIYLKDKDGNIIGQKNIEINRITGISNINSNIINVNSYGKIVNIDITKLTNNIETNIKSIENYNKNINGTLVNKIFLNASLNEETNSKLVDIPSTSLGSSSGLEREFIPSNDNYGVSYYYRGKVNDNFVNYKGMCFRIVRVEGDGSIKIILADKNNTCESSDYSIQNTNSFINNGVYGYDNNNNPNLVNNANNTIYYKLNQWYNEKFSGQEYKLKKDIWCLGDTDKKYSETTQELTTNSNYIYDTALRIINKNPSLLCNSSSKKYKGYISSLAIDELLLAGIGENDISTSYIIENAVSNNWWTISPYGYNETGIAYIISNKQVNKGNVSNENYIRPVITLNARIYSTGEGTQSNPFIIE